MLKKISPKALALAIFSVIIVVTLIPRPLTSDENKKENSSITLNVYKVIADEESVCLTLNGKIVKYYDIDLSVLPPEDTVNLFKGITVKSPEEADRIIEDFDG